MYNKKFRAVISMRGWLCTVAAVTAAFGVVLAGSSGALAAPASSAHLPPTGGSLRQQTVADLLGSGALARHGDSADETLPRPRSVKPENQFGFSIAISGDTALIGAPTANGGFGKGSGAVYVFVKGPHGWRQQARLEADDGAVGDLFGASVALDGDTAVVGAQNKGLFFGGTGAAYVFVRSGTTWTQQTELTGQCPFCGSNSDFFGWRVGVLGDTALVSAPGVGGAQGAVFEFLRSGQTWAQRQMLTASDGAGEDTFGWSMQLSQTGDTLVVGAPRGDGGGRAGLAYVFARKGQRFVQRQEITPIDGQPADLFGYAVVISGDTVLVGAPGCCQSAQPLLGNVDIFQHHHGGWTQRGQLTPSDGVGGPIDGQEFGTAIAFSGDTAVIGSEFKSDQTGEAYEFVRSGSSWTETQKLLDPKGAVNDEFGHSVAISEGTALVGSPHHDDARGQVSLIPL